MIQKLRQLGVTPAKAALIGVLGVGLAVVWGPQLGALLPGWGGDSGKARRTAASRRAGPKPLAANNAEAEAAPEVVKEEREIPTFLVSEASAYDPFAVPAWSPGARRVADAGPEETATVDEVEQRFEGLRETGVAMILVGNDGAEAVQIGDRMLRVGDEIDGFRITAINAKGVTFKSAVPTSREGSRGS